MNIFLSILLSYFFGAIPFAFIITKIAKNVDLRTVGSGNIGATNAMRVVGFKLGLVALLLDAIKGLIPVVFLAEKTILPAPFTADTLRIILGIASICGHNWTVFLNFKGGKGIATSLGVLIGLAVKNFLFAKIIFLLTLIWAATLLLSGYVSLASILAALFLPVFLLIFKLNTSFVCFGVLISLFAIFRHKSNISRLLQHKENRFDIKSKLLSLTKKPLS